MEHDSEAVEATMKARYGDSLVSIRGSEGLEQVFAEIAAQDTPRSLAFQMALLREVGFASVEVIHKNSCFATFAALKSGS